MGIRYAVLYGKTGVKNFNKLERAKMFAQQKANKMKKSVDIDKITTYPRAKAGQTDWSQSTYKVVKPKK